MILLNEKPPVSHAEDAEHDDALPDKIREAGQRFTQEAYQAQQLLDQIIQRLRKLREGDDIPENE